MGSDTRSRHRTGPDSTASPGLRVAAAADAGEPTAEQHLESALRDAREREHALEAALRETERRHDQFIAGLAHELRNPLAPMTNALRVIALAGHDSSAAERARTLLERQVGLMAHLVEDLLDVSRARTGALELARTRIDLAQALTAAAETRRPLIEAEGQRLDVQVSGAPMPIDADAVRLVQAFSHLIEYISRNAQAGARIVLAAEPEGASALVRVVEESDDEPPSALAQVTALMPEGRDSGEISRGEPGVGVSLAKALVELHGGHLQAIGRGDALARFAVRLPLASGAEAGTPPQVQSKQLKILVVDDNRDAGESMQMLLELLHHEVRLAHDGNDAVRQAEEFLPDVVFMDLGMPGLGGLEATRRIRSQEWGKGIVIVAVSGWGQESDRAESRLAGCNGHLVKPVEAEDLERLLAGLAPTAP